ncbi:signal transduction histidine kinase [Herbaspirillum sp. CF444]|uniref:ATP-binding protein n=1 Tax=Herbaspirillum sp. CF444 TaxID=1144319 RepID=UPI0002724BEA|nr:ATP-binding protein [Herbaspirillum sp. CF444]EJL88365.1 signal transduction histidine kinase [Herbaspirillum sp. CF444]
MKIKTVLGSGFGVIVVTVIGIVIFSLTIFSRLSEQWTEMSTVTVKRNELLLKSSIHLSAAALDFVDYIHRGGNYDERFMLELNLLDEQLRAYRSTADMMQEEQLLIDKAEVLTQLYRQSMQAVIRQRSAGVDPRILEFSAQGEENKRIELVLQKLTSFSTSKTASATKNIIDLLRSSRDGLYLGMSISLLATILTALLVMYLIRQYIKEKEQSLLSLVSEITERKRIEEELKQHRNHLEELINERTSELSIAKERAEVANHAKSTFLASMTHELRTPLNAILGYAQILKRNKNLGERQLIGLNTIYDSGEHLLMLITDLLDLSKIEAGKFELFPYPVNLHVFLDGIGNIIRVKAEQKGLQYVLDSDQTIPTLVLDEKRLRQVMLNLLGNAVKFTDTGQVTLRVSVLSRNANAIQLRFAVEDTGIGLDPGQFETIFQPFEQVGETQRRFGGTGLGLSISRQLVRMMDGDIAISSRLGAGSIFHFTLLLPIATADVAAPLPGLPVVAYQGPRKKILVVDDIAANREMLSDMLGGLGFEICLAVNGEDGVAQAQQLRPDLILMDIVMPVMNGLDATRKIREIPETQSIPVIAISASVTSEDEQKSLDAGVNFFMKKPVQQEILVHKMNEYLKVSLVYDQAIAEAAPQAESDEHVLVIPPIEEIEILYRMALAGDMRKIRQRADYLDTLSHTYHPFAEKLRQLAKSYQSKTLVSLIEKYVQRTSSQ